MTDTFQLYENDDTKLSKAEIDLRNEIDPTKRNSVRVKRQINTPITVIIGNPPYSIGQKSANDNAQNQTYPKLHKRIEDTYAKDSQATLSKSLYDSYIKAIRWATDRIDNSEGGMIAFITNNGWLDSNGCDSFRKHLGIDFSSIYVLNLLGGIRGKSGDNAKKEGQNVFDIMTGVSVTILVKNPKVKKDKAVIKYADIGDYLDRKSKFVKLINKKSIKNFKLKPLEPNEQNDWLNQRNDVFAGFIPLTSDTYDNKHFFSIKPIGVSTGRDTWVYNFSRCKLSKNMTKMIDFYNEQCKSYKLTEKQSIRPEVENFIDSDPSKISWTRYLRNEIKKGNIHKFDEKKINKCMYRPYTKNWLFYDKNYIESPGIWHKVIPIEKYRNLVICVEGTGSSKDFGCLIVDMVSDYGSIGIHTQCFPLYYYEERTGQMVFDDVNEGDGKYIRHDGISDFILNEAKKIQARDRQETGDTNKKDITKEDIFYYVYGFLHSPEYRKTFANDLKKMLPRIPLVDDMKDFWAFSKAGRELADMHLNYEKVPKHKEVREVIVGTGYKITNNMKFGRIDGGKDKSKIIYNSHITLENIPLVAYEYIVNGKSAIEWIMDRYCISQDKKSGIINDANDWCEEVGNPRYIIDLLHSIINLSVKTVEIVNNLPKIKFED